MTNFPNKIDYDASRRRKKGSSKYKDKKFKRKEDQLKDVKKDLERVPHEGTKRVTQNGSLRQQSHEAVAEFEKAKKVAVGAPQKPTVRNFKHVDVGKLIRKANEEGNMKKAVNFGVVGLGQCGCRIAYEFEKLGYPTIAINTSSQDLDKIDCKVKLSIGKDGAGRDLKVGRSAVSRYKNKIMETYRREFKDVDHALVCAGSSGGTGGGGLTSIVETLTDMKLPVGVLTTFPLHSEDTRSKKNTLSVLNDLLKLQETRGIRPLIIIDNAKIEEKHPGLSTVKFWDVANEEVVKTFDLFNRLAATSTPYTSLDPADYNKIINAGGCMIFGAISVKDGNVEENDNIFSEAIKENINSGLFVEGFNLIEATHVGFIMVANSTQLENIPRLAEEKAYTTLMEYIGSGSVYKGVYGVESLKFPEIFFMISGLGIATLRVKDLIKNVKTDTTHMKQKATHRTVDDILAELGDDEGLNMDLDNVLKEESKEE